MNTLFESQIWIIARDTLILLALLKAVVSLYRKPEPKRLAYDLLVDERIATLYKTVVTNIQAQYPTVSTTLGRILLIKLINCGHTSITTADYVRPLSISFGTKAELIAASITKEYPVNLLAKIRIIGDSVQIDPVLLNTGDSLTLEVIINAEKPRVTFDARIVGVRKISSRAPTPVQDTAALVGLLCILVGILLQNYASNLSGLSLALVLIGVVVISAISRFYLPLRQLHFKEQVTKRHG